MPADLDVALLKLTSEDERCMTLSVQNLTCPVYDLDTNVLFEGVWQVNIVHGGMAPSFCPFYCLLRIALVV